MPVLAFRSPTSIEVLGHAAECSHIRPPYMQWAVRAGFPSPAENEIETRLDLAQLLIGQEEATFIVRVKGTSMTKAGIRDGDLLVVNRALTPQHNDIVVAAIDGESHTVKRLHIPRGGAVRLLAESDIDPDVELADGQTVEVWGVVTSVIHQLRRCR